MYQEIQAILAKYPEIKRIRIEKEEIIERQIVHAVSQQVTKPLPPPTISTTNPDLFVKEEIKEFPKVKKTLDESSTEAIRNKQIKDTLAGLQLPKV